jgi:radical S-adenosyl methionine domain-containing protein 2
VPEPNSLIAKSYLILDEYMRFLDRDRRQPLSSILEVGVSTALAQVYWDQESFLERGGVFEWSKEPAAQICKASVDEELQW